jgi:hypothetical protein
MGWWYYLVGFGLAGYEVMGMLVGGFADVGFDSGGFAPEIIGREYFSFGDRVVRATGVDADEPTSTAEAHAELVIWNTGSDIEVRISGNGGGGTTEEVEWWDDLGVSQGTSSPALSATTVFKLNEVTGVTVNIYTVEDGLTTGMSRVKRGTFTDDDKTTFFSPTASTEYGYQLDAEATDPPGLGETADAADTMVLQFTFRKTGYADYTINFGARSVASANQL